MATLSRMVTTGSRKVERRQSAAQRVAAKLAAQQAAMVAGVEAAEKAHAARQKALAQAEEHDDALRKAVADLVAVDQSLEDIAELTGLPLSDIRAARRPKRAADDDGEPDVEEPAEPVARAGRGRREPVERLVTPVVPPPGDGGQDGDQGAGGDTAGAAGTPELAGVG